MIVIDQTSFVPPFEQVRSQFATQISQGVLPAGSRLPTVRRLAKDLGLAVNTVARAYRELESAGLVATRGRGGTTVTSSGDASRERLQAAAASYAEVVRTVGVDDMEAVAHIKAALTAQHAQSTVTSSNRRAH